MYYFRIKKGYIFLLKLFLFASIFLIGCASSKTVDPYGLEDRLKLSRDYQQSLEEMEENYKEEARRVQGQQESDQSEKLFSFPTLRSLLPFKGQ